MPFASHMGMSPLVEIIRSDIRRTGAISLSRYMEMCLGHPQYGYYMTRDPLGVSGDFTTAPEISQMFGELVGIWLADTWIKMGAPARVHLVELGPGRGTLMQDALRATAHVPGFHDAISLHLVETSPVLRERQAVSLSGFSPLWHGSLETIPADAPLLCLGNEFLDALPVDQLCWTQDGWQQVKVTLSDHPDEPFRSMLHPAPSDLIVEIPPTLFTPEQGERIEVSLILNQYLRNLFLRLQKQQGSCLFIDYGYRYFATGDSIQALYRHQPVSIFMNPGEADITAHVNFENIKNHALSAGLTVHDVRTQGEFLITMGIDHRLKALLASATLAQAEELRSAYHRLVSPEQMGSLFKVIGVTSHPGLAMAGWAA